MRAFGLVSLGLLAVVGHAFDTLAWTRDLEAHTLDSRSPKGGKSGGGGGSHDEDEDEGDGDSCVADQCPPDHELCGSFCIPTGTTCCDEFGDLTKYCQADERCVSGSDELFDFKCCPADDEGCSSDSGNATEAPGGMRAECESGAAVVSGIWAVGVMGAVVAFGL